MKNSKIYNLIESYGTKCIELNFGLISNLKLNENSDLKDINYFLLPLRASKLKIINHIGSFILQNKNVEYHIHGTGITFYLNEIKYSFNLEPTNPKNIQPIFSISELYDYIILFFEEMNHNKFIEIITQFVNEGLLVKVHEDVLSYYIPHLELSKNVIL